MRMACAFLLATGIVLGASAARAQAVATPARTAQDQGLTVVTLAESAQRDLRRDRLRIQLRVEQAGRDAARVQADVNRMMAAALERARAAASGGGFRVETGGYAIYQERVSETREMRWRARQDLVLVGGDAAAMLPLAGQLQQDGLLASGMGWELGEDARRAAEQALLGEALARLRARAEAAAQALGAEFLRFATVAIDPQPGTPMPMPRMMAAPMAMAAPAPEMASEAGVETVRVGVQGEALARPRP
jgi:predicted secreted protein